METREGAAAVTLDVRSDRPRYRSGDVARVEIALRNAGRVPVVLTFPSAQRYELALVDDAGATRWRWSDGRAFAMMLGEEELEPGAARLWKERVAVPAVPGRYRLVATLTAMDVRAEGTALLDVAGPDERDG